MTYHTRFKAVAALLITNLARTRALGASTADGGLEGGTGGMILR